MTQHFDTPINLTSVFIGGDCCEDRIHIYTLKGPTMMRIAFDHHKDLQNLELKLVACCKW